MRVKRSKRNRAAELCLSSLGQYIPMAVEVLLAQAEVHYKQLPVVATHYKVRWFDVSVDEAFVVDFSNGLEHFAKKVNGDFQAILVFEALPSLGEIHA